MNAVLRSYLLNISFVFLFGWGILELYRSNVRFSSILQNPEPSWEITMNISPFILAFLLSFIIMYVSRKQKQTKLAFWLFPLFFPEADEREQAITAKACRSAFISIWTVVPFCACLLPFYPIIASSLPEYPIYLLLFILLVQMTVFHISLYRNRM